jgi:prolyl oligopeptidase
MKKLLFIIIIIINALSSFAQKNYVYPIAPKDSIVNEYFDTKISDPYQWMENPDDPRLLVWIDSQKELTQKLANNQTRKRDLRAQIASIYSDVKTDTADNFKKTDSKLKSKYVFKYELVRDNRARDLLYRLRKESMDRYLVNIKDFRLGKNDHVVIASHDENEEEDLAVIRMSVNGSDWQTAYLFDLKTGKQLSDTLKYLRNTSNIEWHGKNVYYDRYNAPEKGRELLDKAEGQKLYYHTTGTSQREDKLVFQNPDTTGTNYFTYFREGKRLFFNHYYRLNNKIVRAFSVADEDPKNFLLKNFLYYPNADSINIEIEHIIGDSILLKTNWMAPNERVLLVDIKKPNKLSEFVPEYDINLREVKKLGKDKIACIYRNNGQNIALIFNLSGELLKKIEFPKGKKVNGFYELNDKVGFTNFSISSFYHPPLLYQLSLKDLTFEPIGSVSVPYDPKSLETRYVEY